MRADTGLVVVRARSCERRISTRLNGRLHLGELTMSDHEVKRLEGDARSADDTVGSIVGGGLGERRLPTCLPRTVLAASRVALAVAERLSLT